MARIEIVHGTLSEVHQIIDNLRDIDRLELAITSSDPAAAVLNGWAQSSYRRIFTVDGAPIVVYGVVPCPFLAGGGSPWMVATPEIDGVPRDFLVASRAEIEAMRAGFTDLRNATHKDNTTSLNWLRWLGFRINPEPVGPGGVLRMFSMPGLPGAEVNHV